MASRGADQFSFIVTSDGSMDAYPSNKTSSFKILLKEPIEIGDEDWEVSLLSINYPYSWTNVGPAAKVYMKYYVDMHGGVREINFPNWQCKSMEDVLKFMMKELHTGQSVATRTQVWFGVDELGRFKVSSTSPAFDIGFSENMLKLLGLGGHENAVTLTVESFDKRQVHRSILDSFLSKENMFDFGDEQLIKKILMAENLYDFASLVYPYIGPEGLMKLHKKSAELWDIELEKEFKELPLPTRNLFRKRRQLPDAEEYIDDGNFVIEVPDEFEVHNGSKAVYLFMKHLKGFLSMGKPSNTIKGVTPGILNPVQRMLVYINIIDPIDMNDKQVKLLKLVNTKGEPFKTTQEEYVNPTYVAVQKGKISMIEVFIASETGDPVSFQSGTVVLTLHFRKTLRFIRSRR